MLLFDRILAARGLDAESKAAFLIPEYSTSYDPFLLPDMDKAVERILVAKKRQDKIAIYGDYDIDGLTASTLLLDALNSFGFKHVEVFIPNRFQEGYGLSIEAIEKIAKAGAKLIITVDSGSDSEKEINKANDLKMDVIVTDHHSTGISNSSALAFINPKRQDNKYPFRDLAAVGVAFKLVQALQTRMEGLPVGQEKWLLDLVALGTVCDIVSLVDENRTNVYFGLKVLSKTKRPGLKAVMAIAGIDPKNLNARSIGFGIGPRMNAAGRLETAQHALDMLTAIDPMLALEKAQYLDTLNKSRRAEQDKIFKQAIVQVEDYDQQPVLVVSDKSWNHGIVGIVATKLLEKYKKPSFVFQELDNESKGSARSYGDFSLVDVINSVKDIITKGGGHNLAAGVTLPTQNIAKFRKQVNDFYAKQGLVNQQSLLLPCADADAELSEVTEELVDLIAQLEPFGIGNPQPIIKTNNLSVLDIKRMGADSQHVKLNLQDSNGKSMQFLAFNAPDSFFVELGSQLSIWYHIDINEWRGRRSVEGQILHIEVE